MEGKPAMDRGFPNDTVCLQKGEGDMKGKAFGGRFLGAVFFLAAVLLFSSAAQAKTIWVGKECPYQDIQSAIDASQHGDVIVVKDGAYSPPNAEGIDFKGKAITLRSENGPEKCIIDGGGSMRGFVFHSMESVQSKLIGFTIRNCNSGGGSGVFCYWWSHPTISDCIFSGNTTQASGGAIFFNGESGGIIERCVFIENSAHDGGAIGLMDGSNPTITDCKFIRSSASYSGGAIWGAASFMFITGCTFSENSADRFAGGIWSPEGTLDLTNCTFRGNSTDSTYGDGGAVYLFLSRSAMTGCTFSGNSVVYHGGAIYCSDSLLDITNCTLSGNSADFGGGIYCLSPSTITNCTLSGNSAFEGGGIYCYSYSTTITNCTLSKNSAEWAGGGIYCLSSYPTITNCTLSENSSERFGGGIYCDSSSPAITNCTLRGNWTGDQGGGGGIYCDSSYPTITNCTLSGNWTSWHGGGIYCDSSSPAIINCTLSGNSATGSGGGIYSYSSSPVITNCILRDSAIYNSSNSNPLITYSNVQGGYSGEGNIDLDPQLVDATAGDFHLKAGSPCIDAGANTASSIPKKDKDGANRIIDGNVDGTATVDMGAYEYQGTSTAVRLASFKAVPRDNGEVVVRWKTASETDNAGFHLWRSHRRNGKYVRLTEEIIPAKGTAFKGARYRLEDLTTRHGKIYFYKLEDVDFEGVRTFHGPVRVRVK
jgi:parallel beta-helix repeat protein/predicted outer membrane repeat protein